MARSCLASVQPGQPSRTRRPAWPDGVLAKNRGRRDRGDHAGRQLESGQRLGHEIPIQGDQRRQRLLRELPQPVGDRAAGGQPRVTIGSPPR
jgi:hypothetical protein